MKKLSFLFFTIGLALSCSFNKNNNKINAHVGNKCLDSLDSLSNIMRQINYGLYSIDLSEFSIDKFEGLSDMELIISGIPLKKNEQRTYQFIQFIRGLDKSCCRGLTKENIRKQLGQPTNISKTGEIYQYLLNTGFECPNCNVPPHRIFENCDYIRFNFKDGILFKISFK